MTNNQHSRLFNLASKFLKFFLLALFGFAIAYVVSISFGMLNLAVILLPLVLAWILRLGLLLLCLLATTVVIESLR